MRLVERDAFNAAEGLFSRARGESSASNIHKDDPELAGLWADSCADPVNSSRCGKLTGKSPLVAQTTRKMPNQVESSHRRRRFRCRCRRATSVQVSSGRRDASRSLLAEKRVEQIIVGAVRMECSVSGVLRVGVELIYYEHIAKVKSLFVTGILQRIVFKYIYIYTLNCQLVNT